MAADPPTPEGDDLRLVEADAHDRKIRQLSFLSMTSANASGRRRWHPEGEDPPSQVITEYAAADERPDGYPEELPFVVGVETFTTTYPAGSQMPSARYSCADPERVLSSVVRQSEAAGWNRADLRLDLPGRPPARQVVLQRGGMVRTLAMYGLEGRWLVQLVDVSLESLELWRRNVS